MLSSVSSVWGTSTETYIVDDDVRVYTADGKYLRRIGRRGEGPGEYDSPNAVAVGPSGNVFVMEASGGGQVHLYGPNGEYLDRWTYPSSFTMSRPFLVDGAADIYAPTGKWAMRGGHPHLQQGFTRISAGGTVHDAVLFESQLSNPDDDWALLGAAGRVVGLVPLAPRRHWEVGPYGLIVSGESSTNEVSIAARDALEPTVVTLGGDPIPIDPAEARYIRTLWIASKREIDPGWVWTGRDIPETKPPYNGFLVSVDSMVWILREGAGSPMPDCTIEGPGEERLTCWESPWYADVFKSDGVYLGEIQIPDEISTLSVSFIGSDFLLARIEDAAGTLQVVRYAIEVPQ